jgi:glycosyltransferase involved in cell wall biosynthesis
MSRARRILVSAYACEPARGSEPGVGWNQVKQIARFHEVWVITRKNNADSIQRHGGFTDNVHWSFYDLPPWMKLWKRGQRGVHLYYYLWQIGVYRLAKRMHASVGFDLIHHVTFVNYWMPSFLTLLPVPFIWGPLGGGESIPRGFWSTFGFRGKLFEVFRSAARWLGEHDPWVRMCARRARVALATTHETAARLAGLGCREVEVLSVSGISSDELRALARHRVITGGAPRLVSVGRLVDLKGYHLSIRAFARVRVSFPGCAYCLIGTGPERARLEGLAEQLGVLDAVHFLGNLPRAQVLDALGDFDILVHPVLHDSGGWACAEAMAAGRPVICLDLGGSAVLVTSESGIRVPAGTPEETVAGLSSAMERLMAEARLRARMGEAARDRASRLFDWNVKGEAIRNLYERVLGEA